MLKCVERKKKHSSDTHTHASKHTYSAKGRKCMILFLPHKKLKLPSIIYVERVFVGVSKNCETLEETMCVCVCVYYTTDENGVFMVDI